ncbi:hypothetical protein NFI96_029432 [Prochilodus magdalenae]|nr:hypothetical protein NFI96_029432 [Prochilodus magdalenae]
MHTLSKLIVVFAQGTGGNAHTCISYEAEHWPACSGLESELGMIVEGLMSPFIQPVLHNLGPMARCIILLEYPITVENTEGSGCSAQVLEVRYPAVFGDFPCSDAPTVPGSRHRSVIGVLEQALDQTVLEIGPPGLEMCIPDLSTEYLTYLWARMTEWETAPAVAETPEIKLFGKWSTDDVQINDISLQDYIAVKEKYAKYLPHSGGRYAAKRFRKAQCPIVERLTNSMMMHGRNNGKKLMTVRIVKHAFEIIHLLTGENPLQVLVNAIINSGPREDSTRIGRAGTVRRQAVDVSPLRRVNQAIWLLCTGAREAAFRNIKTIAECLADELINAAKNPPPGSSSQCSSRLEYSQKHKLVSAVLLVAKGTSFPV